MRCKYDCRKENKTYPTQEKSEFSRSVHVSWIEYYLQVSFYRELFYRQRKPSEEFFL